jgi:small GTP-binding protein
MLFIPLIIVALLSSEPLKGQTQGDLDKAVHLFDNGKFTEAQDVLNSLIARLDQYGWNNLNFTGKYLLMSSLYIRGAVLNRVADNKQALIDLDRGLELLESCDKNRDYRYDNADYIRDLYSALYGKRAQVYLTMKRFDETIADCKRAGVSSNHVLAKAYQGKGSTILSAGNANEAIAFLESAAALDSTDATTYGVMANAYSVIGKEAYEVDYLTKAYKLDHSINIPDIKKRSLVLYKVGETDKAASLCENWLGKHPVDSEICRLLVRINIETGNYDRGFKNASKLLKLVSDKDLLSLRAICAISLGNDTQAIADYKTALVQFPRDTSLLNALSQTYYRRGELDSSKAYLEASQLVTPLRSDLEELLMAIYRTQYKDENLILVLSLFVSFIAIGPTWKVGLYFSLKSSKSRQKVDQRDFKSIAERFPANDRQLESHAKFIEELLTLSILSEDAALISRSDLEDLRRTASDRFLRLAVLGEFDAGKTSLINAILGEEIFVSSILPTTATICEISYGPKPKAVVFMDDGTSHSVDMDQVNEFIQESKKTDDVARVLVELPNALLQQGLIIYDTPGVNVLQTRHASLAQSALFECNAALFVEDMSRPGHKESQDLLRQISERIPKTVFVLNKMDLVDADEQQETRDYYAEWLKTKLGIASPEIFYFSARAELRNLTKGIDPSDLFVRFRERLWLLLRTDKDLVLLDRLLLSLGTTYARLSDRIRDERAFLIKELGRLSKTKIPDPQETRTLVFNKANEIADRMLETGEPSLRKFALKQLEMTLQGICSVIMSAEGRSLFKPATQVLEKEVLPWAKASTLQVAQTIDNHIKEFFTEVQNECVQSILNDFRADYSAIADLEKLNYYSKRFWGMIYIFSLSIFGSYFLASFVLFPDFEFSYVLLGGLMLAAAGLGWLTYHVQYTRKVRLETKAGTFSTFYDNSGVGFAKLEHTGYQTTTKSTAYATAAGWMLGGPIGGVIGGVAGAIIGSIFGKGPDVVKKEMVTLFSGGYESLKEEALRIDLQAKNRLLKQENGRLLDAIILKYQGVLDYFLDLDRNQKKYLDMKKYYLDSVLKNLSERRTHLEHRKQNLRLLLDKAA